MGKIIINNRAEIPDTEALDLVKRVINMGRVSNNNTQYCYLSICPTSDGNFAVSTDKNAKSDRFTLTRYKGAME